MFFPLAQWLMPLHVQFPRQPNAPSLLTQGNVLRGLNQFHTPVELIVDPHYPDAITNGTLRGLSSFDKALYFLC